MGSNNLKFLKTGKKIRLLPLIFVIVAAIVTVGAVALFSVLFKPGTKSNASPLVAPSELEVYRTATVDGFDYFASFAAVDGADKYILYISDANDINNQQVFTHSSTSTVVKITKYITEAKKYKVGVQAINTSISAYSSDIIYTSYENKMKLETPQLRREHEVFSWNSIDYATSYSLVLRYSGTTETMSLQTTSYDLSSILESTSADLTAVRFTLSVKAVYDGALLWEDSGYSSTLEYIVTKVLDKTELALEQDTNVLSWTPVDGASGYEIYFRKGNEDYEKVSTVSAADECLLDLNSFVTGVGTYSGYIKVISDEEYTFSSTSDSFEFSVSTQIATPSIIASRVDGEYLEVTLQAGDNLGQQTYYYLRVYNDEDRLIYDAAVTTLKYQFMLTVNPSGYYKITVTAKNDINPDLYNDSEESEPEIVEVESQIEAPANLVYSQPKASASANLNWTRNSKASSYYIYLFTYDEYDEEVPFGEPIIQTSATLTLPFNTAGYYYARVKALATESQFYRDSDFSETIECMFKEKLDAVTNLIVTEDQAVRNYMANVVAYYNELLGQEVVLREDDAIILWTDDPKVNWYTLFVNETSYGEESEIGFHLYGISYGVYNRAAINLVNILDDPEEYPSSETMPYYIKVRPSSVGERENELYEAGPLESAQYYLVRQLATPEGLTYTQTDNKNEAFFTWNAVENATDGYTVTINGNSPAEFQRVVTTTIDVSPYMVPGINTITVKANKCLNYRESEVATISKPFTYFLQSAQNFSVYLLEENGEVNYYATFKTHRFANYYRISFYATYSDTPEERELLGQQSVAQYYTNNDVITLQVNPDNIKKYDDCVTTIEFLTAYSDSIAGATEPNFNSAYILGDNVDPTYTKSVTRVSTFTNQSVLVMINSSTVEILTTSKTSRTVKFKYPTGYVDKVRYFVVTVTRIDSINGNTYTTHSIAGNMGVATDDINYLSFSTLFENLDIGDYTVTIYATSSEANVTNSGKTYAEFVITIIQDAPDNITMYESVTGDLIAQWDLISTHTQTTSYCATLYRHTELEDVLVQQWTSKLNTGETILRDGRQVHVIQINFSTEKSAANRTKSVAMNMVSGEYYLTVQTNGYGDYYIQSALGTMDGYYSHTATIDVPELIIDQANNAARVIYTAGLTYTLRYHLTATGPVEDELQIPSVTKTISGIKYVEYNLLNGFDDTFDVGTYYLSIISHRSVGSGAEATVIDSDSSALQPYRFMKSFTNPNVTNSEVIYEYINNRDKATLETNFDMVSVDGVTASDYLLRVYRGIFIYEITVSIIYDGANSRYNIVALTDSEHNLYTTYTPTSTSTSSGTTTYNYVVEGTQYYTLSVNQTTKKMFIKIFDVSTFTANTMYYTIVYTLDDEDDYYKGSTTYGFFRFKYMLRWLPPTTAFVNSTNHVITERRYVELTDLDEYINVKLDGTVNGSSTSYNYRLRITNLLTGEQATYGVNKNKDIQNIAGVGTTYKITSDMINESGLYKVEFSINSSGKVESRYSTPLYIYNALKMSTPIIEKIRKAETPAAATEKDIKLQWSFDGYGDGTLASMDATFKANTCFTVTIDEADEDLNLIASGLSFTKNIYLNDAKLTKVGNIYTYTIEISDPALSSFVWIKPTEDEYHNPIDVTHYKFTITASAFSTDLNSIITSENLITGGEVNTVYVPDSSASTRKYVFFSQSGSAVTLFRCDNKLNAPEQITFVDGNTQYIVWNEVYDPADSDTTVGYKYVYYYMNIDGRYILCTANGLVQIYYNQADKKFYTESAFNEGSDVDFTAKKRAYENGEEDPNEPFWLDTTAPTLNGFAVAVDTPTIFGVWVFAYATNQNASVGSSKVFFGTTVYSMQFEIPETLVWNVSEDNSTHTIVFDNTINLQLNSSDLSDYLDIYNLTLGGYQLTWFTNNLPGLEDANQLFVVDISQLYNLNRLAEYVDESNVKRERLYDWKIVLSNYEMTVYDPAADGELISYALFVGGEVASQVYRSIIIERNVADAEVTDEDEHYYATFEQISSATKYEILLVNAENEPIMDATNYFTGGTVPANYVEKINIELDYDNQYTTYVEGGKTKNAAISIVNGNITVDITPLLNGRVAGNYYLAIYTLEDPSKFVSLNGFTTASSVMFGFQKAYSPVENIEFGYDDEGVLQTISWTETHDSDGGLVHDYAYYRIQVWKKVPAGQNYVLLTLNSSGDKQLNCVFSGVQGISGLTNVLTGANIWYDTSDELDPRIYVNIGNIFKQYLVNTNSIKLGGEYTVGITVAPASSTKSSFSESTRATADFIHRVKLEFDETATYVQFLIDGYLDEASSVLSREATFTDSNLANATMYLQNETVDGNFNVKSFEILQWLPEIQSTEIVVYVKQTSGGSWVETARLRGIDLTRNFRVFLHEGAVQLRPGINTLAIQAVGINDYYVESELKQFTVKAYFKHPTPTMTFNPQVDVVYENASASFAGTPTKLTLHLDDSWAQKRYGVVVYAYYYKDGVYEPYLAWQSSDQNGDDWRNRLIWTTVNGTACFVYPSTYTKDTSLRNKVVNFMDFFDANANQTYGAMSMVSLVGTYDFVFRAKIFANSQLYADTYYLNSEFSQPTSVFRYTYQLVTPELKSFGTDANGQPVYEQVIRDENRNATTVNISWKIDPIKFKAILKYSITVWDGQSKTSEPFSRGNGNYANATNTVEYAVYVQVYYTAQSPVYSIYAVTVKNYKASEVAVLESSFSQYFTISGGYVVFNMMPFINSQQRTNTYIAGVYRYHVKAVQGRTAELSTNMLNFVQNSYINGSGFTGRFISGSDVDADYNYYTSYIHSVPYPVAFSSASVDTNGMLSMTLKDTYATARLVYIKVNNVENRFIIEAPTSNSTIYYSNIASYLIPGIDNVVTIRIGEVEYYFDGVERRATNEFAEWTHELAELKNITWAYNAGMQEISWNTAFSTQYAAQEVLDSGEGTLDADLVHFKIDLLYSNASVEYDTTLSNSEIYDYFASLGSVQHLVVNNLENVNGTCIVKFAPRLKSYTFDLIECVNLIDSSFIEDGGLKGGFYTLKLTITAKDQYGVSPVGAENYFDGVIYIIQKQIFAPWKMSDSGEFWSQERNYLSTSNQTVSNAVKEYWADNKDINWGIKFTVNSVNNQYPEVYRVFYWRDDSSLPYDNYFDVSGDNISVDNGVVYLNFKSGFSSVVQAGVYNFAWMAKATDGVAEASRYSYIITEQGATTLGLLGSLSKYKGYGLSNYVRVGTPVLANELSNQSKTSCTISWTYVDSAGELKSNLSFTARLVNFLGEYIDGQTYPTGVNGYGPVSPAEERRYIYQSNGDTTLNMQEGDNFVSIQALPLGHNAYYLASTWSDLKLLYWAATLAAPVLNIYLSDLSSPDEWQGLQKKTIPENESSISGDEVNAYDTADRGGTRETSANETTFTGNITIEAKVAKTAVIDNTAYLEIMTYDPVTNSIFSQSNALCHFMVRGDAATGMVYRYRKREIDYYNGAQNSEYWVTDGSTQIGTCVKNSDGTMTFYVYGLKIYELFPTVVYTDVWIKSPTGSGDDVLYSGVRNFADIPQSYQFVVRAYTAEAVSQDSGFSYKHSLRFIAPEITNVNFDGTSIKTIAQKKYIANDTLENYDIILDIDKVSRNATHILVYAFVDQENGNNYYNDGNEDFDAAYNMHSYSDLHKHIMLFDIRNQVTFATVTAPYGTVTLTINKGCDLWRFINQNTPNAWYFAAQAVTDTYDMNDFVTYEGNYFDDYSLAVPEQNRQMVLRYSESYIGQYKQSIIYRQFEKAKITLKMDYGQVDNTLFQSGTLPITLQDSNPVQVLNDKPTNLSELYTAYDPYLVVEQNDFANAKLTYEYEEIKKYGGYVITVTLPNGTKKQKTVYSVLTGEAQGAGLLDAEEAFNELVQTNNPVRYTFEGNDYIENPILEDPCIYKLLLELFGTQNSGASLTGGQCVISLQAIAETRTEESRTRNYWISQDEVGQNTLDFVFYLRPKAVKLTLDNAVFNTNNPLVVDWETTISENELLYPNSVNLSWTASSPYIQTYKVDITRVDQNTSAYKTSYNQGAAAYSGTSQNLVAPVTGWGGDSNLYGEMMSSKRFNNWDERNDAGYIDTAVTYKCVIETNPILDKYIGRSYPSGASAGSDTTNYTYYNVQLKYNTYNGITIKSSSDNHAGNGEPSENNFSAINFSTTTNGNNGVSVTKDFGGTFDHIGYTEFTIYGPFSYRNNGGSFTAVNETREGACEGFSVDTFKYAVNELLNEVNNAAGGVYTIRYRFVYSIDEVPSPTTPFIPGEISNTITYTYYRNVYAPDVSIEVNTSSVDISATSDDQDYAAYFQVRIWQYNAAASSPTDTAYNIGSFSLKTSVGYTQSSAEGSYRHQFDPTRADALSSRSIQSPNKFISGRYTYYTGALQGGLNAYDVVITAGDTTYNIPATAVRAFEQFIIPSTYAPTIQEVSVNANGSASGITDYCDNIKMNAPSGGGDSGGGGGAASSTAEFTQTWHYASITGMPTRLTFDIKNAFAYSYSCNYETYSSSGQNGTASISKSSSILSGGSSTNYSTTSSWKTINGGSFGSTCYRVTDVRCSVSCKSGFASVIDGEWNGGNGIYLDDSLTEEAAFVRSSGTSEEKFATITVNVGGELDGEKEVSSSVKVEYPVSATSTSIAKSRAKAGANITVSFEVTNQNTWTEVTTTYKETFWFDIFGIRWHKGWEANPPTNAQQTGDGHSGPDTVTISVVEGGASQTQKATMTINKCRPNNVSGSPPAEKKEYKDEKAKYSVKVNFSWAESINEGTISGGGGYVPGNESSSGLSDFLLG